MGSDKNGNKTAEDIQIKTLREILTQVIYQNQMMLGWVNGAVVTVDKDGMILSVNEMAMRAFGYTEEEMLGKQHHDMFHHTLEDGSEYPWFFCPVYAAIEDGSSHHITGDQFWDKSGASFSVDCIVSPTRDDSGTISGATIIFRNLTEMRLQEAKRIHGMKLESIGELASGIAHEINTPIQFIGSNMAFLAESFNDLLSLLNQYRDLKDNLVEQGLLSARVAAIEEEEDNIDIEFLKEEIPLAIEQTSGGVDRVAKLVLGLKGYSHSADNSQKRETDINEVISNTLIVCTNAYKYVAELETDLGQLPVIKVHAGDIGQVILNLVVNAAQAIEAKKGDSGTMGTIKVTSCKDGDDLLISVGDTGGGIPQSVAGRIFDPFFTTKEVGSGSGQGLAIARNIIHDKNGGDLSFETEEGVGTTFYIRLPIE